MDDVIWLPPAFPTEDARAGFAAAVDEQRRADTAGQYLRDLADEAEQLARQQPGLASARLLAIRAAETRDLVVWIVEGYEALLREAERAVPEAVPAAFRAGARCLAQTSPHLDLRYRLDVVDRTARHRWPHPAPVDPEKT